MTTPDDEERFLRRWSRLKRAADEAPDTPPQAAGAGAVEPPPPVLADTEKLDFSSDFTRFLGARVEESVKRAALKKLFHSLHFHQMDGLDVYVDDYGKFEPMDDETLNQLAHARDLLFREQGGQAAPAADGTAPGGGAVAGGSPENQPQADHVGKALSPPSADAADAHLAPEAREAGSDNR